MSGISTYRLEAPRPRPPPPPLRPRRTPNATSVSSNNADGSQTLLYDLPSSTISPPASPVSRSGATSPKASTLTSRSRMSHGARSTPPPSARNRSTTPLGISKSELEKFAEYCQKWYFNQDDDCGRLMTHTLANLPPSQRAPFSRLQASIRSAYHEDVAARRDAEFLNRLSATQPGGSLMLHCRADPSGSAARDERFDKFERFVRNWCTAGMPGTKPFFEALWAVMRLQVVPEHLGGAGQNRIEWEFDDAVFKEAAGKDFMLEAVDVLKGVLGFEETTTPRRSLPSITLNMDVESSLVHSRSQSQPFPSSVAHGQGVAKGASQAKRPRAPSDPFLDTPAVSRSMASSSSRSSRHATSILSTVALDMADEPPSPGTLQTDREESMAPFRGDGQFDDSGEAQLRVWTFPDLSNPEILSLLKVYPPFITRRPLPRFPVTVHSRRPDIEEGEDEREQGKELHFGTGVMWISPKQRSDSWKGGWWTAFTMWLKKLFCR